MTDKIEELKRIASENDGVLTAEAVVEAASDESNPLHDSFCWDNSEAAHLYRLHQARNLIRVSVTMLDVPNAMPQRVFVSLTPDREVEGGGYRALTAVMSDAEMRAQLLMDAQAEMEVFERKYNALVELAEVFAAMRKVRKIKGK